MTKIKTAKIYDEDKFARTFGAEKSKDIFQGSFGLERRTYAIR